MEFIQFQEQIVYLKDNVNLIIKLYIMLKIHLRMDLKYQQILHLLMLYFNGDKFLIMFLQINILSKQDMLIIFHQHLNVHILIVEFQQYPIVHLFQFLNQNIKLMLMNIQKIYQILDFMNIIMIKRNVNKMVLNIQII